PSDHPQALKALERELPPYVMRELGRLAWNRRGTLQQEMDKNPSLRTHIKSIADTINREWSRLSEDQKSVEAFYSLELEEILPEIIPSTGFEELSEKPIGWVPVPEDSWTGILIYVPENLPVRGTGLSADIHPALYARVLSDSLKVLADPSMGNRQLLSYRNTQDREKTESLIGRRPYRVMARELYGDYPCDIILSKEDTRRILAADSGRHALSEGRIAILIDSKSE
ncbi:MAG: hypothetical protein DRP49_03080, partial [Spirochaetes bacterium]